MFLSSSRPASVLARAGGVLAPAIFAVGGIAAQDIRVNGPLPAGVTGDVTLFQISPDSRRVVYSADQDVDEIVGLYSAPIGGGPVVRLAARIAQAGSVRAFRITPDSRTVVYHGDPPDGGSSAGLFSVSILGRQPATRLDEPFPRGEVAGFELSPDSRRVVYRASQDWTTSRYELFSVPVNGGSRVRLNGPLVGGGSVHSYRLSPDARRVVYLADQETDQVLGIYSVAIEGGSPVKLSGPLGAFAYDFEIAPDSKSVVYRDADYEARLFSVSILGGASTQLAGTSVELFHITPDARRVVYVRDGGLHVVRLTGGPSIPLSAPLVEPEHIDEFEIAPNSKRVVYHVEHGRGPEGEEEVALYTVPIGGGIVTELARSPGLYVSSQQISPDSSRVLYRVYNYSGTDEVWSAPIEGGSPTRLVSGELYFFGFHPDARRILYVTAGHVPITNAFIAELFSLPVTGGTPTRLNGPLVEEGWVYPFAQPRISPDGARVVYLADQERDDVFELFSVPIGGGPATRLNPDLVPGGTAGDVEHSLFSPDGRHVLYRADQETDEVHELYSVTLLDGASPGAPVKLNGTLVRNGDVAHALFKVTPDSRRAVYVADQEVAGIGELYSVPIEGGVPVKLNAARGSGIGIHGFDISPDSRHVVFLDDPDEPFRPELYSAPIDGGAPIELSAAILDLDFVNITAISSDSSRVVFTALHADQAASELYSIPIAGGPLTTLNPFPVAGGRVFFAQILPDSRTVVYYGDLERDDVVELYSVPIDGGPSTKLSGALVTRGDVSAVALSPDSARVIYRADQEQDEVVELYSVTPSGAGRIKLNPALVAGGDVRNSVIAPDSSRVVYLADQNVNEVFELFSVPIGGGTATRLNAPLVANGDVEGSSDSYQVSPASDRVVYLADQERNEILELYSVPLAGGPVTKLNGPLVLGGRVERGFAISADARSVVYRADEDTNEVFELFAVPLAGGEPPTRLNAPLTEYGNVIPTLGRVNAFQLAGNRVLYRADQDEDEVFELYLSFLTPARRNARAR